MVSTVNLLLRYCTGQVSFVRFSFSWTLRAGRERDWGGVGIVWYNKTNMTFQHGQHSKPAAQILHRPSEFCKFQLVMDFGFLGMRGWGLFSMIKQIWHPCGVGNMIVYPSLALSPEGVARGLQCSLGVDNHVGNPTGMSYLYIIIPRVRILASHWMRAVCQSCWQPVSL